MASCSPGGGPACARWAVPRGCDVRAFDCGSADALARAMLSLNQLFLGESTPDCRTALPEDRVLGGKPHD